MGRSWDDLKSNETCFGIMLPYIKEPNDLHIYFIKRFIATVF